MRASAPLSKTTSSFNIEQVIFLRSSRCKCVTHWLILSEIGKFYNRSNETPINTSINVSKAAWHCWCMRPSQTSSKCMIRPLLYIVRKFKGEEIIFKEVNRWVTFFLRLDTSTLKSPGTQHKTRQLKILRVIFPSLLTLQPPPNKPTVNKNSHLYLPPALLSC